MKSVKIDITYKMSIKFKKKDDGYVVESLVQTNFGTKPAANQMFWSDKKEEADAFMQGVIATVAIFNGEAPKIEYIKEIDKRHGGPWDRGSADAYYRRPYKPHYYKGSTGTSEKVEEKEMTPEEIAEYAAGRQYQQELGEFKDYG